MLAVLASFGAMIFWGVGDFLTQRVSKEDGKIRTLFFSTLFGLLIFIPVLYLSNNFSAITPQRLAALAPVMIFAIFTSLINLEAYKRGKISVVEPIMGLELPLVIILGGIFLNEKVYPLQLSLIVLIFAGTLMLLMTTLKYYQHRTLFLEKGGSFALMGALALAISSLLYAYASRQASFALTFCAVQGTLLIISSAILAYRKKFRSLKEKFLDQPATILGMGLFNASAWILFGYAVTKLSIFVVLPITQGYIIVAVLLGIIINKEKISLRQSLGAALAVACIIYLAYISR